MSVNEKTMTANELALSQLNCKKVSISGTVQSLEFNKLEGILKCHGTRYTLNDINNSTKVLLSFRIVNVLFCDFIGHIDLSTF